jgi:hypothetical protein
MKKFTKAGLGAIEGGEGAYNPFNAPNFDRRRATHFLPDSPSLLDFVEEVRGALLVPGPGIKNPGQQSNMVHV